MKFKHYFLALLFLTSLNSFSQILTYKSGRIYDSNNQKLSNSKVKELLKTNTEAFEMYNTGRTKAGVGGFLLGFGIGLTASDLVKGMTQDIVYPTTLTYIGVASSLIAIPIIAGHSKKIKKAVALYNESHQTQKTSFNFDSTTFITNQNGIGMRITF